MVDCTDHNMKGGERVTRRASYIGVKSKKDHKFAREQERRHIFQTEQKR